MTRNTKVSKTRILFTIMSIAFFIVIVVKADAFSNTIGEQTEVPNPNFIGSGENQQIGINPDNINISENGDDSSVISYIVQEGDTLEKISKEFGVPAKDLKSLNKIGDQLKVGQKLVVSDNKEGILYVVKKERSLKLFAEFYRLNLEDLMTLNHFSDNSEMLYPGQEIFINVSEKRAYDIGLLEKAQPILPKDELPKPKPKPIVKKASPANSTSSRSTSTKAITNVPVTTNGNKKGIIKKRYHNPKVSNGFAVGYCTRYAAMQSPGIFGYMNDNVQERPFGGNAKDWYANAKAAGYKVGQTPRVGAIIVYKQLRSYAGHVGVVKAYYPDSGEMIIEDMNYAGKYIVTQRRENANRDGITGYIYP